MRALHLVAVALLAMPFVASAATGPSSLHAKTAKRKKGAAAAAEAPPPPPPTPVHLSVEPSADGPLWKMHLTNAGDVPVKVLADPRLLSFEGRPEGAKRSIRCNLPSAMQPSANELQTLVLPEKRTYSATFDVRKYCFHDAEAALLAPGFEVTARYGVHEGTDTKELAVTDSLAVSPIEGVEPKPAGARELVTTFKAPAAPDASTSATSLAKVGKTPAQDAPELELRSAAKVDTESPFEVVLGVTLKNRSDHSLRVRFRPETLAFDVVSPSGIEHCAWPNRISSPTHEAFDTLGPKQELTLDIELSAYCREHSFDASGLLVVRPHMDTRGASGKPLGIQSFDGEVVVSSPTLIRLWSGRAEPAIERPKVDPLP